MHHMMPHGCGRYCAAHMVGWWLVFIGAINWGLIGAFQFNLVGRILGGAPLLERLVYVLVGLAALFMLLSKKCKGCMAGWKDCCKMEEHEEKSGSPAAPASGGMGGGPMAGK